MRVLPRIVSVCVFATAIAVQAGGLATADEDGNWEIKKSDDRATSGSACVLKPKQQSRIQVTPGRLELTGLPKNSILNFQYILDDAPASRFIFPSTDMQNAGAVWLDGDVLKQVVAGQRLQIRVLDRWHEAITEDVGLNGLRNFYENIVENCK